MTSASCFWQGKDFDAIGAILPPHALRKICQHVIH